MGLCQFSQYVEYDGILDRTTDHIVLMTDDNSDPVKLSFAYDQDSELIISDFSHVSVKGYYNNMNNVLKVEEIDVQSDYYYGP